MGACAVKPVSRLSCKLGKLNIQSFTTPDGSKKSSESPLSSSNCWLQLCDILLLAGEWYFGLRVLHGLRQACDLSLPNSVSQRRLWAEVYLKRSFSRSKLEAGKRDTATLRPGRYSYLQEPEACGSIEYSVTVHSFQGSV